MKTLGVRPLSLISFTAVLWSIPVLVMAANGAGPNRYVGWFVIAIALTLIVAAFLTIWILQAKFLQTCTDKDSLELYAQLPFGVPAGTIRSTIALIIVFASLAYIALEMAEIGKFPDIMAGILGTILGFYFGTRAEAERVDADALARVGEATLQRDRAVEEVNESKLTTVMAKARAGVEVVRTVSKVLPKELAAKVGGVADVVTKGLAVADGLAGSGKTRDALAEKGKAVAVLQQDNPIKDVLLRATKSFGDVLGTAVPPLAIVSVIVAVGSRMAGAAYERWVSRVLNAPYTPELFPAAVIDASVARSIIRGSPIFREAFAKELEVGERDFIRTLVNQALSDDAINKLWARDDVARRFKDRETLQRGLEEFQRAAMTEEVLKDIDPKLTEEAGGVNSFLTAIDKLNANPQAQRDLDAIVLMTNQLKREGKVFEPAFKEAIASIREEQK
jgi:hypothetical protein